jgi:hypothetical protein
VLRTQSHNEDTWQRARVHSQAVEQPTKLAAPAADAQCKGMGLAGAAKPRCVRCAHLVGCVGVEATGWFIKEEHPGPSHQRDTDVDSLGLAGQRWQQAAVRDGQIGRRRGRAAALPPPSSATHTQASPHLASRDALGEGAADLDIAAGGQSQAINQLLHHRQLVLVALRHWPLQLGRIHQHLVHSQRAQQCICRGGGKE